MEGKAANPPRFDPNALIGGQWRRPESLRTRISCTRRRLQTPAGRPPQPPARGPSLPCPRPTCHCGPCGPRWPRPGRCRRAGPVPCPPASGSSQGPAPLSTATSPSCHRRAPPVFPEPLPILPLPTGSGPLTFRGEPSLVGWWWRNLPALQTAYLGTGDVGELPCGSGRLPPRDAAPSGCRWPGRQSGCEVSTVGSLGSKDRSA